MGENANKLMLQYVILNDTTYARLDSALLLIDSIYNNCPKYYSGLTISKLKILCYKKEYPHAISFIDTLDEMKLNSFLKKSILLNRFLAMQSQYNGDTISRKRYLNLIVKELKDSLSRHSLKLDSVLRLTNVSDIFAYEGTFTLIQYYYYRAQIEGIDKIKSELDKYRKRIKGNNKAFEILKKSFEDDFMIFNGL